MSPYGVGAVAGRVSGSVAFFEDFLVFEVDSVVVLSAAESLLGAFSVLVDFFVLFVESASLFSALLFSLVLVELSAAGLFELAGLLVVLDLGEAVVVAGTGVLVGFAA